MVADNELNRLRALARERHRAATRKVSRLRTGKGVNVAGTSADPRRDALKIKRYNRTQLKAYIAELDKFNSRSTQYVGDSGRRPMSSQLWSEYKALERRYNQQVADRFSRIENIFAPQLGMTLGERMAMVTPKHRQMAFAAVNAPYKPPERIPRNVSSDKALKKLIADMKNRLAPEYVERKTREGREHFLKMAEMLNDKDLINATNSLSNEQFDVLWNYTPFARAISLGYEMAMAQLSNDEKPWHSQILHTALGDARANIEWAGSLNLGR